MQVARVRGSMLVATSASIVGVQTSSVPGGGTISLRRQVPKWREESPPAYSTSERGFETAEREKSCRW
jgi:hypothetical protein